MSGKIDPDSKMNMSLDQIIQMDKSITYQRPKQSHLKKRKRRNKNSSSLEDHSVPMLSSLGSGYIYVTKNSPLLSEQRRRIMEASLSNPTKPNFSNKTRRIIPACYHLIKTETGIEKVLLPVRSNLKINFSKNKMKNKKDKKRKNKEPFIKIEANSDQNMETEITFKQEPNPEMNSASADGEDDDVVVLYSSIKSNEDVKDSPMDVTVDLLKNNSLFSNVKGNDFIPQRPLEKTLNDRFTTLNSGNSTGNSFPSYSSLCF